MCHEPVIIVKKLIFTFLEYTLLLKKLRFLIISDVKWNKANIEIHWNIEIKLCIM